MKTLPLPPALLARWAALPPFIRYTFVVGVGFGLDWCTFTLLHHALGVPVVSANVGGGVVGVTFAYFVAAKHIFEYRGHMLWPKLAAYLAYQVVAVLAFSYLILAIATMTGLPAALVKIGVVPVQFITNYLILRNLLLFFERRV